MTDGRARRFHPGVQTILLSLFLSACGDGAIDNDGGASVFPDGRDDAYVVSDEIFPELEASANDDAVIADFGDPASQFARLKAAPDGLSNTLGEWSNAMPWPLLPIHATLLPGGNVLTYGADGFGQSSRAFSVDRWSPAQGLGMDSHQFTPTGIDTNIFCSAQTVLWDGNVLLSGGDQQPAGPLDNLVHNDGIRDTTLYDPVSHNLSINTPMNHARWYPTLVTLSSGPVVALGGRAEISGSDGENIIPIIPEIYYPINGIWRELPGAAAADYYQRSWFYPRAFVNRRDEIIMFDQRTRDIFAMSALGDGSFTKVATMADDVTISTSTQPAAMFRPGKVLMLAHNGEATVVDIDAPVPRATRVASTGGARVWADATVLADGTVLLSGGSRVRQQLDTAVHFGEIWNPDTDTWTATRASIDSKARLYHSTAMLLPDASVLVAGGGAPGPVFNQNADIFYPPYLFAEDGSRAPRPQILDLGPIAFGTRFNVVTGTDTRIAKVALVRAGSVTHSFDMGQRYMELGFNQTGGVLNVAAPSRTLSPPGLHMVFLIDENGVPSIAETRMLR